MKFITDILTGVDGKTFDMGRVSGMLALLAFIGNSITAVVLKGQWDPQSYGLGFGAMAAGLGALLKLKENSEPKN